LPGGMANACAPNPFDLEKSTLAFG